MLCRPYLCCRFPNAVACLLHRRIPPAFLHLFPYACLIRVHTFCVPSIPRAFRFTLFRAFLQTQPRAFPHGFLVGSFLRSLCIHRGSPSCVFPFVTPCIHCASRAIGSPCVQPCVFGSRFLVFSNEFINGSPMGPCNIHRAFLVCDTARFLRRSMVRPCALLYKFPVHATCVLPFSVLRFMLLLALPCTL